MACHQYISTDKWDISKRVRREWGGSQSADQSGLITPNTLLNQLLDTVSVHV